MQRKGMGYNDIITISINPKTQDTRNGQAMRDEGGALEEK